MKVFILISLLASLALASVDINSANEKELSSLKGIGAKKAAAIVAYREKHCFQNINELAKVKGISTKIIEKNKKDLKASKCKH